MLLFLFALQADAAALVDTARRMTSAENRCVLTTDTTDVTVCGLRRADRFRAPLVTTPSRRDNVAEQRATLTHARTPMEDMGPFLVGGGAAGVTATVGGEGGAKFAGMRPPAP
ncbi:hypothetical protein [Sphingomonas sp. R86521]|uniref:hypothetical protein n=1 Tax=Sphingomonas sp. R86521 TaxID=3093860 RepID=UPI0036D39163